MQSIHDSLLEAQREIDGFTFTQLDDPSREFWPAASRRPRGARHADDRPASTLD
ncbi:hypothetical protein [Gulosibacter hominis]|uniref:hypothetical protein n=1 Tax=Gulosibacter hominis TaxID=2770504 RepID=UPI001918695A|nr:hypothetical protein [Gulosibacter hominis]